MSYIFSICYIIKNYKELRNKVEKIAKYSPKKFVEIFLYDTVNDHDNRELWQGISNSKNIYLKQSNDDKFNIADIYNDFLRVANGKYVIFSDTDTDLSLPILLSSYSELVDNSENIYVLNPYKLNDKKNQIKYFKRKKSGYIGENDNLFSLLLQSYIWKLEIAKSTAFNRFNEYEFDIEYIIRQLAKNKGFYLLNTKINIDVFFESDTYNYENQYIKDWYTKTINDIYLPIIEEYKDSLLCQSILCYLLQLRFSCNRNNKDKNILQYEEIQEFLELCSKVLRHIDNSIIVQYNLNSKKLLPKYMNYYLLKIKNNITEQDLNIIYDKTQFIGYYNDILLQASSTISIEIKAINYYDSKLHIDAEIINVYFADYKVFECYASLTSKTIPFIKNDIYSLDKYFSKTLKKGMTGYFELSIIDLNQKDSISFYIKYKACIRALPIRFTHVASRLNNKIKTFWYFDKFYIVYNAKRKQLIVKKTSIFNKITNEFSLYKTLFKRAMSRKEKFFRTIRIVATRLIYWATKPIFSKRKIWITYDQLFKGGDNGEYFFKYVNSINDKEVAIFYIINGDCGEFKRLKSEYKNILKHNSFIARLITLHADYIFATRVDVKLFCGFSKIIELYYRDLFKYKVLCLQHGLTIQQIAEYQNRLFDNTQGYFCASKYEIKNLLHPIYGYKKEELVLTGAPRYDGLINNDKHQILISPTWRRNVTAGPNRKGEMHLYSENFKKSEYFYVYNSLINDENLIRCAKDNGYKIIYLIHPILTPQINDFERNEYVEILGGAFDDINYNDILSESSLMVTDHSGIQYDFAYMRKPIIYYHPKSLPPQYTAKTMDYENMGFGPICTSQNELVDTICMYLNNKCITDDKYIKRINEFFEYSDRNNSKRVYEVAKKYIFN